MARYFPVHLFRKLGFNTNTAKEIVDTLDVMNPGGVGAEDVAAAIDRYLDRYRQRYQQATNEVLDEARQLSLFANDPRSVGN